MLPTEPIGSVPRSPELMERARAAASGKISREELDGSYVEAVKDTVRRFEETGSPVITDGEQRKPSFATYPIQAMENLSPEGVVIPFADGHTRRLPALTGGPFRYTTRAHVYLDEAKKVTKLPVKQAVISASALSLLYPQKEIPSYSRATFIEELVREAEADIRSCLAHGAHCVQIDFTEARLSLKLDPSKGLLKSFIQLNNQVLERFTNEERKRIGVHVCPGGDQDSTHSADIDYAELLPTLFTMNVTNFYVQLASEKDRPRVLTMLGELTKGDRRTFVGVTDPINPRIETPEEVRDRILEAAKHIDPARLGTTDDCGFSPFGDDASTARDIAFAKIKARVVGTKMASEALRV
jgi:5-methyltetrahydropteroyltriglutamate--homocysteine methyltransferase